MSVGPASQAILAHLPDEEAEVLIEANAALYPRWSGLTADAVRAALPEIRSQGHALDHGRLVEGISALAVPILPLGRDAVASIAINMTSARLPPERVDALTTRLRDEIQASEDALNPMHVKDRWGTELVLE